MKDSLINIERQLIVHTTVHSEWQSVVEMARNEHWDLGCGDDRIFLDIDPVGFYTGSVNGQTIASISVVNFNEVYAHLGHYIVKPDYRGKGIGSAVWTAAIEHAGDRCIGLDGMPIQEKNYNKWGFRTHYLTYRMQGYATGSRITSENISQVTDSNLSKIIEFDATFIGYQRSRLLSPWLTHNDRRCLLLQKDGLIKGLIAFRPSDNGYRIGPFYTTDDTHVHVLLQAALGEIPKGEVVTVDIPEYASTTISYLNTCGFSTLFHTCRMYRGTPPLPYIKGNNATTSLELG